MHCQLLMCFFCGGGTGGTSAPKNKDCLNLRLFCQHLYQKAYYGNMSQNSMYTNICIYTHYNDDTPPGK